MDSLNNNVSEDKSIPSIPEPAVVPNTRMIPEAVPASVNKAIPRAVATAPVPTPQVLATAPVPTPQAVGAHTPQAPAGMTASASQAPAGMTASVSQVPAGMVAPAQAPAGMAASVPQVPAGMATPAQAPAGMAASVPQTITAPVSQETAAASEIQASGRNEVSDDNVIKPAFNSSSYNPMPEKTAPSVTRPENNAVESSNTRLKEAEKNSESDKDKKKKALGIGPMIAICAAVGLLVSVIGTVGLFLLQSKTNVLDKIFTAQADVEPEEDPDAVDPDAADPDTVDPDTVTDPNQAGNNTAGGSSGNAANSTNSFNTNYTTVITGSSDVITVTENAMPSMVTIVKEYNYIDSSIMQYFSGYTQGQNYVVEASGSGVIIAETDSEFLIVSNNHVVENPISLTMTFADGTSVSGYIKGCDKSRDLAIVAVLKSDVPDDTVEKIRIASIGDSTKLKLGEQVVAIGNALGYGQSVTTGIVSALEREMETEEGNVNKFIQTDAAINPGNSGGALLNMAGQLIGINSNKIAESSVEGMGYAIPISDVIDIIEELMEHSTKIPLPDDEVGYIGINLQEVTQALSERFSMPVGIYIVDTIPGGAAEAAGLQSGDIITKFDGETITSYDELDRTLKCYAAGTTVTITYQRQENGVYAEHTTQLTLGAKP